jgi:hypothetical protein
MNSPDPVSVAPPLSLSQELLLFQLSVSATHSYVLRGQQLHVVGNGCKTPDARRVHVPLQRRPCSCCSCRSKPCRTQCKNGESIKPVRICCKAKLKHDVLHDRLGARMMYFRFHSIRNFLQSHDIKISPISAVLRIPIQRSQT